MRYLMLMALATALACAGCSNDPADSMDAGSDSSTDTDTDSDSDTDTDTDTDTGTGCASGTAIFDWVPNPEAEDCGPGCTQLVFQAINTVTEWSVGENYLTVTTVPEADFIIVDIENNCHAVVKQHPGYPVSPDLTTFRRPWVDSNVITVIFNLSNEGEDILEIDIGQESWASHGYHEELDEQGQYQYQASSGEKISYLLAETDGSMSSAYKQAFLLDKTTQEATPISEEHRRLYYIRMEGDYVIWEDNQGNNLDIYAHKISTGVTSNLSEHESAQYHSRIDDGRVVWSDLRNGDGTYSNFRYADVYLYDIESEELTRITDEAAIQHYPDISGNRIVWQDSRACGDPNYMYDFAGVNIWMYDLSTGQEHQVTSMPGPEFHLHPQIVGDVVYYEAFDSDGSFATVYRQELSALGL